MSLCSSCAAVATCAAAAVQDDQTACEAAGACTFVPAVTSGRQSPAACMATVDDCIAPLYRTYAGEQACTACGLHGGTNERMESGGGLAICSTVATCRDPTPET